MTAHVAGLSRRGGLVVFNRSAICIDLLEQTYTIKVWIELSAALAIRLVPSAALGVLLATGYLTGKTISHHWTFL